MRTLEATEKVENVSQWLLMGGHIGVPKGRLCGFWSWNPGSLKWGAREEEGFIIIPPQHGPLIPRLVTTKPRGDEDGSQPGARSRGVVKTWRPEAWPKPTACLSICGRVHGKVEEGQSM
ncbi:hypothetical protein AAY473_000700 [Plecturocebus cupreus]